MHAGYYFHVGTGLGKDYPHCHMMASGNYCYEPRVVRMLREDISFGWEAFKENVLEKVGSEDPMKLYVNFRGSEPNVDALLRNRGLEPETSINTAPRSGK